MVYIDGPVPPAPAGWLWGARRSAGQGQLGDLGRATRRDQEGDLGSLVLRGVTKAPAGRASEGPTLASAHYSKEVPWSNVLERRKPEHHPQHTHWPPAEEYHPVQGQVVLLPWEPWASPPPESTFLTGIRKRHGVGVDRLLHAGPGLN